jgi:hypothetical protein
VWCCLQVGRTGHPVSWACFEPGIAFRLLGAPPPQSIPKTEPVPASRLP